MESRKKRRRYFGMTGAQVGALAIMSVFILGVFLLGITLISHNAPQSLCHLPQKRPSQH